MTYAGACDEPMGEFWSWPYGGRHETLMQMASAAHIYGRKIVGAEAFTATKGEKWLGHPGNMKTLGDYALCAGINRFVFHRYAMQPWPNVKPGMSMGPWGLHYEATQTWWELSTAWHEYLARCQQLLRQGLFVADICYLQPEGAPRKFLPPIEQSGNPPDRPAYNFDGCTPEVVLTRLSVKDGRIVLPDGMSYRLLVLPESQTMRPKLLARIAELVEAGATVVGPRPQKSPGLEGYPACDAEVQRLAFRLWGDQHGASDGEHALGKGRIIWGKTPEQVLAAMNVPVDFTATGALAGGVRYHHRTLDDGTHLYFVANKREVGGQGTCNFRVTGKQPEFWWPQTGRIERAAAYEEKNGVTRVPIYLDAAESVFVVFRKTSENFDPDCVGHLRRASRLSLLTARPGKVAIVKATYGVPRDARRTRDVTAKLQTLIDSGRTSFQVAEMSKGGDPAYLVVKTLNHRLHSRRQVKAGPRYGSGDNRPRRDRALRNAAHGPPDPCQRRRATGNVEKRTLRVRNRQGPQDRGRGTECGGGSCGFWTMACDGSGPCDDRACRFRAAHFLEREHEGRGEILLRHGHLSSDACGTGRDACPGPLTVP